jgi:hypothetical protein
MLGYHMVELTACPGTSTSAGASCGPQMWTWVLPKRVGTSTDSTGTGHNASVASYAAK